MARRFVLATLAVAAILTTALGALLIWRVPIAQSVLDRVAEELQIPGARATVERIAAGRLRVADLAAGEQSELTIDSVEVAFRAADIIKGNIDSATIDGLTLDLDLRQEAAPLGSLQPQLDRLRDSGSTDAEPKPLPERLPNVQIRNGRLEAETPYGPASITFDGALAGSQEGDPTLQLQGDLTSALAGLTATLSASGDPQKKAEALLTFSDGRVDLPDDLLKIGKLEGELDVNVEAGRPRAGHGELAAQGLAMAGTSFDRAQANFDLTRERADLAAQLGSDDGSFDLALEGQAENLDAVPQVSFGLRSEIGHAAPIWAFSRPPFPSAGEGHIEVTAIGELPALPDPQEGRAALHSWLAQGALSGKAAATFSRLSLPDSEAEAAAFVDLAAVWANGELSLATRQENRVTLTGLSTGDLAVFALPAGLADELMRITGGGLSLFLPAPSQKPTALVWRPNEPARGAWFEGSALASAGPLSVSLIGVAEAALGSEAALTRVDLRDVTVAANGVAMDGYTIEDLEVSGSFAGAPLSFEAAGEVIGGFAVSNLNGLSADQMTLSLPFEITRNARIFDVLLTQPGRVTVNGLNVPDLLRTEGPVDITLASGEAKLALSGEGGSFALDHETHIGLGETRLLVQRENEAPIPLQVRAPSVSLVGARGEDGQYRGTAAVREAAITLPEFDLALEKLSADLELPGDPTRASADFEIAAARHLANPAAFAPLKVSGRAQRSGETVELKGQVYLTDGQELADVAASHDLTSGSGRADVTLQALQFAPGGLQPAALSPLLAALSEARGTAEGTASLTWDGEGRAGTAQFLLEDLEFTSEDVAVSGLDLRLELDSLQPPASPPHQLLRADIIDVGVPLQGLEARFRLPPDAPGQILIEEASFATVGSRFTLRDALIDPTGDQIETQLQVDELDVAVLFDVLAVEGLSGSGELTGTIPLRRDGDIVTIADARLAARAPGVLQFRSDAAEQALKGGGEHVDLVIQALQDFHYQTLTVTGNLDRDGEAKLRLEILGHNPAVLEGHPFQFNINLTGNPTPILEAMLLSRTLIGNIIERARRLSQ